jgi:phosphorylcholine metabolism protein LicD
MACNKETKRCEVTIKDLENNYRLPICCRQNLMSILMALPIIMEGTHWWLDFGTLLGFYRNNRIIDYDTDVDISVYEDTFDREKTFRRCEAHGFYILEKDKNRDLIRINYSKTNLLHSDIWVWKQSENEVIRKVNPKWNYKEGKPPFAFSSNGVLDSKYTDKLDKLEICGVDYPIPHNTKEYLKLWYGNWKEYVNKYDWLKKLGDSIIK